MEEEKGTFCEMVTTTRVRASWVGETGQGGNLVGVKGTLILCHKLWNP